MRNEQDNADANAKHESRAPSTSAVGIVTGSRENLQSGQLHPSKSN